MVALGLIYFFIRTALTLMMGVGIALVLLRAIFDYAEVNPFTWHYRNVRRATEGVLLPARAILRGFRLDARAAPAKAAATWNTGCAWPSDATAMSAAPAGRTTV